MWPVVALKLEEVSYELCSKSNTSRTFRNYTLNEKKLELIQVGDPAKAESATLNPGQQTVLKSLQQQH